MQQLRLDFNESSNPSEETEGCLIESFFPSTNVSVNGTSERYQRGKTPHTIFTWWARRPFDTVREVIAASLLPKYTESDEYSKDKECRNDSLADRLAHSLKSSDRPKQRVLDAFAGGATIPIEAASLGAEAYAVENNELAHFTQKSLLQFSQVAENLPSLIYKHGISLLTALHKETESLFPLRQDNTGRRVIAYFWSRSLLCPSCKSSLSLQKRPWLSKKKGRTAFIQRVADKERRNFSISISRNGIPSEEGSCWNGNTILCPFCGTVISRSEIYEAMKEFAFDELTAICTTKGTGKEYHTIMDTHGVCPSEEELLHSITSELLLLNEELPRIVLPKWSGVTNPALYGIEKITDLFNKRQQAVLLTLCRLIRGEYQNCLALYEEKVAQAIVAFLSALIDQLADWNGRICMWIAENEQVGRALSGPGLPMMWDYVEVDPTQDGPANLWDKLKRIKAGVESLPKFNISPKVVKGDARKLPFEKDFFDAVVTDPPYFDNIFYNVLADCIYAWKRLSLEPIFPEVFQSSATNVERELTASKHRQGTIEQARKFYEEGMAQVLGEFERVLKPDGVISLIFTHSSVDGWSTLIRAFSRANIRIVTIWELRVERTHRPRGMRSAAINTSFVIVGKRNCMPSRNILWGDLAIILADRTRAELVRLNNTHHDELDVGMAIFGAMICEACQWKEVLDGNQPLNMEETIKRIETVIKQFSPSFSLASR